MLIAPRHLSRGAEGQRSRGAEGHSPPHLRIPAQGIGHLAGSKVGEMALLGGGMIDYNYTLDWSFVLNLDTKRTMIRR